MKPKVNNNFINPTAPTIASPVGVDSVIQALQVEYDDKLTWLEKSFGRAYIAMRKTDNQDDASLLTRQDILFPSLWQGEGLDPINGLANDNLNAYSFFLKTGEETPINYNQRLKNRWTCDISNMFWFNLERIDPNKTYPFTEELINEVKSVIANTLFTGLKYSGVEVLSVKDKPQDIFNEFTIDLAETQHLMYPHAGFRIELRAYFNEDC